MGYPGGGRTSRCLKPWEERVRTLLTKRKEHDIILPIWVMRGMVKAGGASFSSVDKEGIIAYYFSPEFGFCLLTRGKVV